MTMAAAQLGSVSTANPSEGASRELAALGRAKEWLNSAALSAATLPGKVTLVQFGTYTLMPPRFAPHRGGAAAPFEGTSNLTTRLSTTSWFALTSSINTVCGPGGSA